MHGQISPGLASLVIQVQAFFTIFLSMRLRGERVRPMQWLARAVATVGLVVIATHADGSTTPFGLLLAVIAAACWVGGNMVSRHAGPVNMVAYVVWSSAFAALPLFLLSFMFEGWPAIAAGFANADTETWAAVLWQTIANLLFGYAVWDCLRGRYPAATVSPMVLLVPVFGMAASALWRGEPMPAWKMIAMALVMTGLALTVWRGKTPGSAR